MFRRTTSFSVILGSNKVCKRTAFGQNEPIQLWSYDSPIFVLVVDPECVSDEPGWNVVVRPVRCPAEYQSGHRAWINCPLRRTKENSSLCVCLYTGGNSKRIIKRYNISPKLSLADYASPVQERPFGRIKLTDGRIDHCATHINHDAFNPHQRHSPIRKKKKKSSWARNGREPQSWLYHVTHNHDLSRDHLTTVNIDDTSLIDIIRRTFIFTCLTNATVSLVNQNSSPIGNAIFFQPLVFPAFISGSDKQGKFYWSQY